MPLHKLSQKSFVNGQYDRTAQNQESVQGGGIVARGLSYAKNVLSSDRGELRKRLGTKFLKKLSRASVVIPFRMNDENDVILVADSSRVKGYKYENGELAELLSVRPDAAVAFPANNTWSDGTSGTGSITNGNWTIDFTFYRPTETWPITVYHYPGRLINGSSAEGYLLSNDKKPAPQSISISNSVDATCMRSIKLWFWTTSSVGYQYQHWTNPTIQYSDDGLTWTGVQTDNRDGEYTPVSYTPPQDVVTPGGTVHMDAVYKSKCSMTISQTNYGGSHRYWRVYFQTGSVSQSVLIDSVSFVNPGLTEVFDKSSPYTEDQLKNIKYSQDKNTMFIACEGVIPYRLVNNTGELTWGSFTPANTSTIWTTMGGYPAAVSTFQNRVWFGGFENNPQTVIASKFNDYETFSGNTPAQKDDYLNLRCNQLKTKIRNLVGGQKVMYCFSEDGISTIDGGSSALLATNENIEFILKNRMPAGNATPGFKDDVMLYSSSDGTKLYGVDFDLLVNRFQVNDLAIYAKDVTQDKVTELHYVNNESKLVYGLTEAGKMFALLYEKGAYQGFFPLDFNGTVYDITPIKVGRDYKLLMVVFRDGNWYLEEKLDCGHYIDTSTPRLTDEEKKWATYDNLENNIALDCYQTYNEGFAGEFYKADETHIISNIDLNGYIGKSVMLANDNEKDFITATIQNTSWKHYNMPTLPSVYDIYEAVGYNGSIWVAVSTSGYVSISEDGINWSDIEKKLDGHTWTSIAWDGTKFILLGGTGWLSTSVDGIVWTTPVQESNLNSGGWLDFVYTGSMFVAVCTNGDVSTSADGINWSVPQNLIILPHTPDNVVSSICYNGTKLIALSKCGYLSGSTDASTWSTPAKILPGADWWSLAYDGSKLIASTNTGKLSLSDDGVVWSDIISSVSSTTLVTRMIYNNDNLFVFGRMSCSIGSSPYDHRITIELQSSRGEQTNFTKMYPEFTQFAPNLPQVASVGVISEGRYFNATHPDASGLIYLPAPCHKVIYGVNYEAVAIFKIQTPYESLKQVAQVDVSVIDTTHLEVGTDFSDTQYIEKIDDSSYYDLTKVTMNDTYRVVVSDTPEMTKNVILRSNKGVPFTVNAVDMYISYSNLGGD